MVLNEVEIKKQIKNYQNKIAKLRRSNKDLLTNRKKCDDSYDEINSAIRRTVDKLNEQLNIVKKLCSNLPKNSKFASYYCEKMKNTVYSRSSNNALDSLYKAKDKLTKESSRIDEQIKNNNNKITIYTNEINRLKKQLSMCKEETK